MNKIVMKHVVLFLSVTGFLPLRAQDSFSAWQAQQNKQYEQWREEQKWQDSYFDWKQKTDNEYEAWKKKNDNVYEAWKRNSENVFDDKPAKAGPASAIVDRENAPSQNPLPSNPGPAPKPFARPEMKIWSVIVGVAAYRDEQSKLNYCDDDAYRIHSFLKSPEGGALADEQIVLLIDEEASGGKIKKAVGDMLAKATEKDAFLFYFSGHGSPDALLAEDYTLSPEGAISHQYLKEAIANSNAKNVYCIIDACHSGNLGADAATGKSIADLEETRPFYAALGQAQKGYVFMLSSKAEERSMEYSGRRQGIFSYYFIEGLKGKSDINQDKVISITEIFDYTRSKVVEATAGRQTPIMTGDYRHTMPIAIVR